MFRRRDSQEPDAASQEAAQSAESRVYTLSQEELDRRVQAETDRRESKRAQVAREAERKRLRDEDPWAYAEQDRLSEQTAEADGQIGSLFANIGTQHDRYTLDPLIDVLPAAERDRILKIEGAGTGLDGRKLIVNESLKSLEKHWKAEGAKDAEAKLRRNSAFRKQLLAEIRTGVAPEPEFIPGGNGSAGDGGSVSSLLREKLRSRH